MRSNLLIATIAAAILACASGWAGMHRLGTNNHEQAIEDVRADLSQHKADVALVAETKAFADWQALEADPAAKQSDKAKAKADWQAAHAARKAADDAAATDKAAAKAAKSKKPK